MFIAHLSSNLMLNNFDAAATAERLLEAGYEQGATYADHPHRHRYYFFDHDANEYEFVQYLSEDPSERNEY